MRTMQKYYKKEINISYEHNFKVPHQNISKLNPTINKKNYTAQPSWIFPDIQVWFNI